MIREQERYMPIRSLYIANDESKSGNSFLTHIGKWRSLLQILQIRVNLLRGFSLVLFLIVVFFSPTFSVKKQNKQWSIYLVTSVPVAKINDWYGYTGDNPLTLGLNHVAHSREQNPIKRNGFDTLPEKKICVPSFFGKDWRTNDKRTSAPISTRHFTLRRNFLQYRLGRLCEWVTLVGKRLPPPPPRVRRLHKRHWSRNLAALFTAEVHL